MSSACILTNGKLDQIDAKTAHGLIRGTDRFDIIGVVDSNLAPFGLRMRDDSEIARRRAGRFISAYRAHAV